MIFLIKVIGVLTTVATVVHGHVAVGVTVTIGSIVGIAKVNALEFREGAFRQPILKVTTSERHGEFGEVG